mgnify:CR=1
MPPIPDSAISWHELVIRAAAWNGRDLVVVHANNTVFRGPVSDIVREGGPGSLFIRILFAWCATKDSDAPDDSWRECPRPELRIDVSRSDRYHAKDMFVTKEGLQLNVNPGLDKGTGIRCSFLNRLDNLDRPAF